jgi:hypothetical protein
MMSRSTMRGEEDERQEAEKEEGDDEQENEGDDEQEDEERKQSTCTNGHN